MANIAKQDESSVSFCPPSARQIANASGTRKTVSQLNAWQQTGRNLKEAILENFQKPICPKPKNHIGLIISGAHCAVYCYQCQSFSLQDILYLVCKFMPYYQHLIVLEPASYYEATDAYRALSELNVGIAPYCQEALQTCLYEKSTHYVIWLPLFSKAGDQTEQASACMLPALCKFLVAHFDLHHLIDATPTYADPDDIYPVDLCYGTKPSDLCKLDLTILADGPNFIGPCDFFDAKWIVDRLHVGDLQERTQGALNRCLREIQ